MTAKRTPTQGLEYYLTPPWLTRLAIEQPDVREALAGRDVCDVGAGTGAISWAIKDLCSPTLIELDEERALIAQKIVGNVVQTDFLNYNKSHDFWISNPPFSRTAEFLAHCWELNPWAPTLFLQKVTWKFPKPKDPLKNELLKTRPIELEIPNRPSFDGKGTDSIEYCWFWWPEGKFSKPQINRTLPMVDAKIRSRSRSEFVSLILSNS